MVIEDKNNEKLVQFHQFVTEDKVCYKIGMKVIALSCFSLCSHPLCVYVQNIIPSLQIPSQTIVCFNKFDA